MAVEIGDSVAVDGRAGEVVGFDGGRAIVRPFPIPEQQNVPGPSACFVANGETVILKKHFERVTALDQAREQLAGEAHARNEAIRTAYYQRAASADRAWHRERER